MKDERHRRVGKSLSTDFESLLPLQETSVDVPRKGPVRRDDSRGLASVTAGRHGGSCLASEHGVDEVVGCRGFLDDVTDGERVG